MAEVEELTSGAAATDSPRPDLEVARRATLLIVTDDATSAAGALAGRWMLTRSRVE